MFLALFLRKIFICIGMAHANNEHRHSRRSTTEVAARRYTYSSNAETGFQRGQYSQLGLAILKVPSVPPIGVDTSHCMSSPPRQSPHSHGRWVALPQRRLLAQGSVSNKKASTHPHDCPHQAATTEGHEYQPCMCHANPWGQVRRAHIHYL